jgi:hypothetical protein
MEGALPQAIPIACDRHTVTYFGPIAIAAR